MRMNFKPAVRAGRPHRIAATALVVAALSAAPLAAYGQPATPPAADPATPLAQPSDPGSLAPDSPTNPLSSQTPREINAAASTKDVLAFFLLDEATADVGINKLKEAVDKINTGDVEACMNALEAAVGMNKDLPPARLMLGTILLRANNAQGWRQQLEMVAKEAPDTPEVYLQFGDLARNEQRLNDAMLNYERAIDAAARSNWAEERRKRFLRLCYAGLTQVEAQRLEWARAKSNVDLWLRMDPDDPTAHIQLARVKFFLGQQDEALKDLQKASKLVADKELDVRIEKPEVSMGWLFTQDAKIDLAEKSMKSAADKYPEDGEVQSAVSNWMLSFGRIDEAQQYAKRAVELDPDSEALKRLSGVIHMARKEYDKAEQIFRELHQQNPGDFVASNFLALSLIESPDDTKRRQALQLAQMNFQLNQRSAVAAATLGWVAFKLGQSEDAQRLLAAAMQSGQATPDMLFYAAKFLGSQGQLTEVGRLLRAALESQGTLFINRKEAETWHKQLTGETILPGGATKSGNQ